MAVCAADRAEENLAGFGRLSSDGIRWNDSAWSSKLRLEEGNRGDVTDREFVNDAVAVGIGVDTEQFLRLYSHVLVHSFIRELAKRNCRTILMEGPNDEIRADAAGTRCIDCAVGARNDVTEVDTFSY